VNIGGHHISALPIFLLALGVFFAVGVVSFLKQGIKILAVLALIAAALSFVGAGLRM
jgi:hypothetical protein